jgi:hypothetical protein
MSITVISGTTPANTGQLATIASTNLNVAFVSSSYSASYFASSTTASLRVGQAGFNVNGINVVFYSGSTDLVNTDNTIYINGFPFTATAAVFAQSASAVFNATASVQNSATTYSSLQGVSGSVSASVIIFQAGAVGEYVYPNVLQANNYVISGSTTTYFSGASMYGPAGSGKVTAGGPWTTILATADASITVSGSALGEATFLLPRGETFIAYVEEGSTGISVPDNVIQAITVNNPQGTVVAN